MILKYSLYSHTDLTRCFFSHSAPPCHNQLPLCRVTTTDSIPDSGADRVSVTDKLTELVPTDLDRLLKVLPTACCRITVVEPCYGIMRGCFIIVYIGSY